MSDWFGAIISALMAWVSANAFWIGTLSIVYILVSLFAIRYLIIRIPPSYFLDSNSTVRPNRRPVVAMVLKILKNLGGLVVIIIGLAMSIPGVAGQGLLTILLGLSLTDFPGKRAIELRLVRQPLIFRAIFATRQKAGKPPLELPGEGARSHDGGSLPGGDR